MRNLNQETSLLQSHDGENRSTHDHEGGSKEMRSLVTSCFLTLFFFFVELIGGYLAGSLAVMSDAAHLLSDLAGLLISLLAVSCSRSKPSELMSFGYARAEVLGAFISLFCIWTLTAILVVAAIGRFLNPKPVNGFLMALLGAIGLGVNIVLGLVLGHGHSHSHSHDHASVSHAHDHSYNHIHNHVSDEAPTSPWNLSYFMTRMTGADIQSINVRAAFLHVLGDALQSIGVIVAGIIIHFQPKWTMVDPMCTLFFAVTILFVTKDLAAQTLRVLMEGTPFGISLRAIRNRLEKIDGVLRAEHLHVWSITVNRPALSVHIRKDPEEFKIPDHTVLTSAQEALRNDFNIDHATVQISCIETCCSQSGTSCLELEV